MARKGVSYRTRFTTDRTSEMIRKNEELQAAQAARADEASKKSLWGFLGTVVGSLIGGPAGAAIGNYLFSGGSDLLMHSEDIKVDPGKFSPSEVVSLNRDLELQDEADAAFGMGDISSGLQAGVTSYGFGKAFELGGFGEAAKKAGTSKLWGGYGKDLAGMFKSAPGAISVDAASMTQLGPSDLLGKGLNLNKLVSTEPNLFESFLSGTGNLVSKIYKGVSGSAVDIAKEMGEYGWFPHPLGVYEEGKTSRFNIPFYGEWPPKDWFQSGDVPGLIIPDHVQEQARSGGLS